MFETPQFANRALRVVASSWNVAGIFSARSGGWLTVTTARDVTATGITGQRVDQVLDDPFGNKTLDNYLNPAAFAYPATGSLGSHVRASIEGPAYWSIDLALARRISFGAAREIELRLETFNLLNHFNWGNPTLNFDAADFGRIRTQTGTPRVLQFGVKYGF